MTSYKEILPTDRPVQKRWEFIEENKKVRKQENTLSTKKAIKKKKKENTLSTKKAIKKRRENDNDQEKKFFLNFLVESVFSFFFS